MQPDGRGSSVPRGVPLSVKLLVGRNGAVYQRGITEANVLGHGFTELVQLVEQTQALAASHRIPQPLLRNLGHARNACYVNVTLQAVVHHDAVVAVVLQAAKDWLVTRGELEGLPHASGYRRDQLKLGSMLFVLLRERLASMMPPAVPGVRDVTVLRDLFPLHGLPGVQQCALEM